MQYISEKRQNIHLDLRFQVRSNYLFQPQLHNRYSIDGKCRIKTTAPLRQCSQEYGEERTEHFLQQDNVYLSASRKVPKRKMCIGDISIDQVMFKYI